MSKLDIVNLALEVDYLHDIANKRRKFKKNIFPGAQCRMSQILIDDARNNHARKWLDRSLNSSTNEQPYTLFYSEEKTKKNLIKQKLRQHSKESVQKFCDIFEKENV